MWDARIAEVKARANVVIADEMASQQVPILPPRIMAEIASRLDEDDVIVSDASFAAGWISGYIPAKRSGRQFLFARGRADWAIRSPARSGPQR